MDSSNSFLQEKRKEEYQIQHFDFSSSQFTHEVKEDVMSVIEEATAALERSLLEKYPAVDREKISLATRKLIETYSVAIEEWGPSFQEQMDSIFFCIPSHVLLDEDKPQGIQYTREEVEKVDQEIRDQERKLIGVKYMKMKLIESLKAAKKCLGYRSKCMDTTDTPESSLSIYIKAVDETVCKQRRIQEIDDLSMERLTNAGNNDSEHVTRSTCTDKGQNGASKLILNIGNDGPQL